MAAAAAKPAESEVAKPVIMRGGVQVKCPACLHCPYFSVEDCEVKA